MLIVYIWNIYMVCFINNNFRVFLISTALSTTLDLYEAGHVSKNTQLRILSQQVKST